MSDEDGVAPLASIWRRSVRNLSALVAAEVFKVACTATVTVYLAHVLGVDGFGIYGLMLATIGYLTALVDGGFTLTGTRDAAIDRSRIADHIRTIVTVRVALALGAILLLALFTAAIDEPPLVKRVLLLTGFSALTAALTLDWVFYGLERTRPVAAATALKSGLLLIGVLLLVRRAGDVWMVPIIQALSEAAAAGVLAAAYDRTLPRGRATWPACRDLVLQTLPIGLAQVLRAVNYWFGVTLIGLMLDEAVAGQFVAAQKLMLFLLGFASLYFLTYLPMIAGALGGNRTRASSILSTSVRVTSALTLPVAIGGTVLAAPLVEAVYGLEYRASARPFQILIWVLPIVILAAHFRNALIAARRQRLDLACVTASAAANVGLALLLVPGLGAAGAAIAMTASELVLLGATYVSMSRHILRAPVAGAIAVPLAASLVMSVLVSWIGRFGLLAAIAAGAAFYFLLLWAAGALRPADVTGLFRG